ncbi:hypothetical protein [Ruegeria conchae]|uniref:hypothetical protein n=1 Tax=Ruegeria conchae TaxID=981384 RepID=UPI0029C683CD|nr:hypothetical protein [Ruegeria conchae]
MANKIDVSASSITSTSDYSRQVYFLLISLFLAFQLLKLIYFLPPPEIGGDAARKWFLAKDLSEGSLEVFRANEHASHHFFRWGTWLFPLALIWSFGDSVAFYYLSTFIPATLAASIFLNLYYRHFGLKVASALAILWALDPQLNRALFQLLPTGAALLPLALIALGFQRFIDEKLTKRGLVLWLSPCLFWLYGAKETNVFFAPGLFIAVWVLAGPRSAFKLTAICLIFYVIEAIALSALQGQIMVGGRLLELLMGGSNHLKIMFESSSHVQQQETLWDAGIISRWYRVLAVHVPVYIPSILAFVAIVISGFVSPFSNSTGRVAFAIALTALSFVVLTSFFIVSFDPLRLGQPLRPRYVAILLPFSAFALVYVAREMRVGRVLRDLRFLVLIALVYLTIGYFSYQREIRALSSQLDDERISLNPPARDTLASRMAYFETYGRELPPNYCNLEKQDFKQLYFGLMYVRNDSHAPSQIEIVGECTQATGPYM